MTMHAMGDLARVFSRPVFEEISCSRVSGTELDMLLAQGWRHFGTGFFRMSHAIHDGVICGVMALRLDASEFAPGAGLRRISRKNRDTTVRIVPAQHCAEYDTMFFAHRSRFKESLPESLRSFLSENPFQIPCPALAVEVRLGEVLVAVSFLAIGENSVSAIYGMFDPGHARRSLGIFTMLLEIEFAAASGRTWYYPGYAYSIPSPYDYKLRLPELEMFNWDAAWQPVPHKPKWSMPIPDAPKA